MVVVACSSAPLKDFKTLQYLPDNGNCFTRILPDGSVETECYDDNDNPDWITVKKSFFNKELDYQDLLIRECKKWR